MVLVLLFVLELLLNNISFFHTKIDKRVENHTTQAIKPVLVSDIDFTIIQFQ